MKNLVKLLAVSTLLLVLAACAGTMQTASVLEAYKHFENKEYDKTLVLIKLAENSQEASKEKKAELTYLKAEAYSKLGQSDTAETLYKYLAEQHSDSQYGYLASQKLVAHHDG